MVDTARWLRGGSSCGTNRCGGIYTLDPSEGTVVRNNVFHDLYAYSYGGWGLYTDEGSTGILFENDLVYRVKTDGFHQHYGRDNMIRNNGYWDAAHGKVDFVGKSIDQWQAAGHEQGSIVADPQFENPQQDDFHLQADSPALELGFNPFDYTRAGVYGDPGWIEKANKVEYPPLEVAPEPPPLLIESQS